MTSATRTTAWAPAPIRVFWTQFRAGKMGQAEIEG
jgi:hypothetical protein